MKVFLNSSTGKAVCTWQQAQLRVEKTIKRWYLYQSAILIAIIFRCCRLDVQMYCLQYKISCSNIVAVWFVVGKIYATSLRVLVQIVLKHTQSWKLNISFPYIYSETLLNWTPSIPETPLIPNISCGPKSTCSYTHNPFKPNLSCHPGVSGLERFYCSLY